MNAQQPASRPPQIGGVQMHILPVALLQLRCDFWSMIYSSRMRRYTQQLGSLHALQSPRTPGLDYILIDSGAATHVCPRDYANQFPLEPCGASTPRLFAATNDEIPLYGVRKVHRKSGNEDLMVPFYVCDVKYPVLSVTRLLDRGFQLRLAPESTTLRSNLPSSAT